MTAGLTTKARKDERQSPIFAGGGSDESRRRIEEEPKHETTAPTEAGGWGAGSGPRTSDGEPAAHERWATTVGEEGCGSEVSKSGPRTTVGRPAGQGATAADEGSDGSIDEDGTGVGDRSREGGAATSPGGMLSSVAAGDLQ